MGGELIVEPYCSVVDALPGSRSDFPPQFGDAAFENDFRRVRQVPERRRNRQFSRFERDGLERSYRYLPLIIFSLLIILFGLVIAMSPGD